MKTIFLSIALIISGFAVNAQSNNESSLNGTTITVHVPIRGFGGSLIAGLYNEATFMKAAPLQGVDTQVMEGFATVVFTDVPPGTYAISLFHDKNGNKTMDFEANGMPKESYGVSNNNMSMGPPQWSDAKFEVGTSPIKMEIRL